MVVTVIMCRFYHDCVRQARRLCTCPMVDVTPTTHGPSVEMHPSTSRPRVEQRSGCHSVSHITAFLDFDRPSTMAYGAAQVSYTPTAPQQHDDAYIYAPPDLSM